MIMVVTFTKFMLLMIFLFDVDVDDVDYDDVDDIDDVDAVFDDYVDKGCQKMAGKDCVPSYFFFVLFVQP